MTDYALQKVAGRYVVGRVETQVGPWSTMRRISLWVDVKRDEDDFEERSIVDLSLTMPEARALLNQLQYAVERVDSRDYEEV